jgi:peroxiredoxin Q/BCP
VRALLHNPYTFFTQFSGQGDNVMEIGNQFPLNQLVKDNQPLELDKSHFTVVYFYPKDDTPGCTLEAKEFEQLKNAYHEKKIRILGVSIDDAASHQKFCEKFGLTFELVSDPQGRLGAEMGIMKGALHQRVTFCLDSQGKVVLKYLQVTPAGHAQQILNDLAKLG